MEEEVPYTNKEEEIEPQNPKEIVNINNKARIGIFVCLVCISGFSACDGGIIPQQLNYIKEDFGAGGDSIAGFFSSVDYIGRVVGAFVFAVIMGMMNRKLLLASTLIFKAITLLVSLIPLPKGMPIAVFNIIFRGLSGISQVFITTYLPVWCDQYGKEKSRTIMITIIQLCCAIGIIIGYGIGLLCELIFKKSEYKGWRPAFALEGIILLVCGFIILSFDKTYFSQNFVLTKDNEGVEEVKKDQRKNILSNFGKMLCNFLFLFTTLGNSMAFFALSVIQYWVDQYMDEVMHVRKSTRFISFAILVLLGPILGILIGGIIVSKLGGYCKRSSMVFVIIACVLGSIISIITSFINNYIVFLIVCLLFLFSICSTIPPESGIIISSLDNSLKGDGFSLSGGICNLIGNFPAAYIFSLFSDWFKGPHKDPNDKDTSHYRKAWLLSMCFNFLGVIFVVVAGMFRFRIPGDLNKDELKDIDQTDIGKLNESLEYNVNDEDNLII